MYVYDPQVADIRNDVQVGHNVFEPTSMPVRAGDILGLYIEAARVSLDFSGNDPTGPVLYDTNVRVPQVGDAVRDFTGASTRTYSLNATVEIRKPSS